MEEAEAAVDPMQMDFIEVVDIMSKVPSNFHEAMSSSKWKDRKGALDALLEALKTSPKIADSDEHGELAKALAKRMSDANIMCVIAAANCIETLAKGVGKPFGRHRSSLINPMLERLKERKVNVADAIGAGLDAVFLTTTLSEVTDDILNSLKSKNPQVKEGTLKFLNRSLGTTRIPPAKDDVKPLSSQLATLLEDSDEKVRTGAAEGLGLTMKIVGERALSPVTESMDDIRKAKVKEAFEKAQVKCKVSAAPPPKPPPAAAAPAKKKKADPPPKLDMVFDDVPQKEAPAPNKPELVDDIAPLKAKPLTRFSTDVAAAPAGGADRVDVIEELLPRVDLEKLVRATSIVADAKSGQWKIRKEALELLQSILDTKANQRLKPNMGEIGQVLKDRIADTNKAVQALALDIITRISNAMNKPFEKHTKLLTLPVATVLSDRNANFRARGVSALNAMATACEGLDSMCGPLGIVLEAGDPVQRGALLGWLVDWFKNHEPSPGLDLASWASPIVSCLEDRNADVRKGAQAVLPVVISCAGYDHVLNQTDLLKPASRSTVLPLIRAARGSAPKAPTPAIFPAGSRAYPKMAAGKAAPALAEATLAMASPPASPARSPASSALAGRLGAGSGRRMVPPNAPAARPDSRDKSEEWPGSAASPRAPLKAGALGRMTGSGRISRGPEYSQVDSALSRLHKIFNYQSSPLHTPHSTPWVTAVRRDRDSVPPSPTDRSIPGSRRISEGPEYPRADTTFSILNPMGELDSSVESNLNTNANESSPVIITHEMSIPEMLKHLGQHGCKDVTSQLDISKCSAYPVSYGGLGDIYCGILDDGSPVSIKCLRLRTDATYVAQKQLKRAAHELYVWSKCIHANILSLIGVAQYRNQIAMVSPWMENGNLGSLLSRQPQLDCCAVCVQIAEGVAYLHSEGIVHGDLKGDNILFSQDFTPKLADFGNAALREYTLQFTNTTSRASMSVNWAAPEVIKEETGPTMEADIFSLGMTILEVITGSIPYAGMRDFIVMNKIINKVHPARPEEHIPSRHEQADALWSLLTSCWAYNPQDRPNAIEVQNKMRDVMQKGLPGTSTG